MMSHCSGVSRAKASAAASGRRDKSLKTVRNLTAAGVRLGCSGCGVAGFGPSVGMAVAVRVKLRGVLEGLHDAGEIAHLLLGVDGGDVGVLPLGVLQVLLHAKLHHLEIEVHD